MGLALGGVSIYIGARNRADEHKWHESQRACRDCGIDAVVDWIDRYWLKYARGCWLEHVRGIRCYLEFHMGLFGVLESLAHKHGALFDAIANFLDQGQENLEIINWAIDTCQDLDMVVDFLEAVDMNSCKMSCHLLESYEPTYVAA